MDKIKCSKCKKNHPKINYGVIRVQNKEYIRKICKLCRSRENKLHYAILKNK